MEGGADDHEFGGDYSVPEGALSVEARSAMDKQEVRKVLDSKKDTIPA